MSVAGRDRPGAATRPGVAGVVLAAGAGRRFGGFKALAWLGGGSLVGRAVRALVQAGCTPVLVVSNPGWPPGAPGDVAGARLLANPGWAEGMGASLRLALEQPEVAGADAVALLLADTPLIGAECLARVLDAGHGPGALVQATYAGARAHPVLIGREHMPGVRATAVGDVGARPYLAAHRGQLTLVECGDVGSPVDVDTPADLHRLGGSADPCPARAEPAHHGELEDRDTHQQQPRHAHVRGEVVHPAEDDRAGRGN